MSKNSLTRSQLINKLSSKLDIPPASSEQAVKQIITSIINALSQNDRVEIRRFGSFEVRSKEPRIARNPKTGEKVRMDKQYSTHFKAGLPLRKRIDQNE